MNNEKRAAAEWLRITEGGDEAASMLIDTYGYEESLALVRSGAATDARFAVPLERWRLRLDALRPFNDSHLSRLGAQLVTRGDALWPSQLDDLGDVRPLALWVMGSAEALTLMHGRHVAIVGSRAASTYGSRIGREFGYELAKESVIVSGGAFGIDAEAHKGALANNGTTIIVTAGGVDRPYPRAHANLFAEIVHNGAVVSESPIGASPQRFRFLSRNRIIAGLSAATIVVEAPIRSGALSTARHALEYGRDVGAVPGPITSPTSVGTHELIRHGATLVSSADHVRELITPVNFHPELPDPFLQPTPDELDPLLRRVLDAVPKQQSARPDSIARVAGVSLSEAMTALGRLSVLGRVLSVNGAWRTR